ncbi:MAG: ATP-binding protein [Clostridia bacterium]|nr:ATP-binding protein [Clostridia bacterium]
MRELSLHILDIVGNSVRAGATLITINITTVDNLLTIEIIDNGHGMSKELLDTVCDPFTTSRTTRKVGMGIPLFKMACQCAGGQFTIDSTRNVGTTVKATFLVNHIDRAPLGDLVSTMITLISEDIDYLLDYQVDDRRTIFDTRQVKQELGDIPIDSPEILIYIKDLLTENIITVNGGRNI